MRRREAVRIEVRAAEIAAQMICEMRHDMTIEELVGWMRCGDNRERGSCPESPAWQAGWLAAIIWAQDWADKRPARLASRLARSSISR